MRRTLSIILISLACTGLATNAQAGISVLRDLSRSEHTVRVQSGQEQARQAVGLQYTVADLRHL
jgi:hypothetical protein